MKTVEWSAGKLRLIDQVQLPHRYSILECSTLEDAVAAIRNLNVRGAPAIGVAAAYALVLAANSSCAATREAFLTDIGRAADALLASRPTAVNLAWAVARMRSVIAQTPDTVAALRFALLSEAHGIAAEDEATCRQIGAAGAPLVPDGGNVLTHCNAGGLATVSYGTALGILRAAREQGKAVHVFVDETRPVLQGARLTAWELSQEGIPLTLITDSMAGHFMQRGKIDLVVVGADRIAANGDVANKIGTYPLAVLAKEHGIPFYVAAPTSSVDLTLPSGDGIPIEERDEQEVVSLCGHRVAPEGVRAANPAFDVTPHRYVTAIVTQTGVIRPPFEAGLRASVSRGLLEVMGT